LFVGGGTPTIYSGEALAGLLSACREFFQFADDAEISVEANPNTISEAKFIILKKAGVNRISIGVQTFENHLLRAIGRSHSRAEAFAALRAARSAGFNNVSLDLIYGLPGQQVSDLVASLAAAFSFAPEHISLYELMVEEGTAFAGRAARGELALPNEAEAFAMESAAYDLLSRHGYERYEIANFSRPGFSCRHNINYWQNGSYLGLGAGAVSYLDGRRIRNVAEPEAYRDLVLAGRQPIVEGERLDQEASFRETVIMGLRMLAGIDLANLERRFGISVTDYYGKTLADMVSQGWLAVETGSLRLTAKGLPLANQVLSQLV
jgi:oxygen-independent coproporphyrinogen-3 oxidase